VKAYKALRRGRMAPFSGVAWPEPGSWIEGDPNACVSGVHACATADLPYWLCDELWEVELAGDVARGGQKLVAPRGRLVREVDGWDGGLIAATAFAGRVAERVERCPAVAGYAADAAGIAARPGGVAAVAMVAVMAAGVELGEDGRDAERRWQAAFLAERFGLDPPA
jgi:hypothetical protein